MSNILKIIIISVALGTVAWVLRMRVVEPDEIGRLCTGHAAPPWCISATVAGGWLYS
ncbi:MAG: hypothetical protein U1F34_04750 [Gammaproteobacteria bacterium]